MKKSQYLSKLKVKLIKSGLKKAEIEGALQYYDELIDEAIENGHTEEEAVLRLPSPQAAADEIIGDFSDEPTVLLKENTADNSMTATAADLPKTDAADDSAYTTDDSADNIGQEPNAGLTSQTTAPTKGQANSQQPSPTEPKCRPKKTQPPPLSKIITRVVLAFLLAVFVLPIVVSIFSVVLSLFAAIFAATVSLVACGIIFPIYAIIVAIVGKSLMLLFVYFAVGFACLALGLLLVRVALPLGKLLYSTTKGLFRATISLFRRI